MHRRGEERIKRTKRVGKRVVKCNLKKGETSSRLPFHPWEEGEKEGRKSRLVYNSARIRQLFRTLPTKPLYHLVTVATPPVWFRELRRGTSSSQTTAHTPMASFTTFITMHRSANIAPLLSPSPRYLLERMEEEEEEVSFPFQRRFRLSVSIIPIIYLAIPFILHYITFFNSRFGFRELFLFPFLPILYFLIRVYR